VGDGHAEALLELLRVRLLAAVEIRGVNTTIRSAGNVARTSSIVSAGSLSPVSPAASTPSSSSRSTAFPAASASATASSASDTQKRELRHDQRLGSDDLLAERGPQHVGVHRLRSHHEQPHDVRATGRRRQETTRGDTNEW
jgi:hypothetical protein